tara:strand:- start:837 stop:1136 length:300 start_codon:yes stop_codon:yes gene_type:complete
VTIKCPNCKSEKIIKRGLRKNKSGAKQKYRCSKCDQWFVDDNGFKRMRHDPTIITKAIHMHKDGMSLFNVANHLWQYDGVRVTPMTISNWGVKYGSFLK